MFIARFDSSGGYKWAKNFGNGLLDGANAVGVDPSGNVAVSGVFQGTLDFGCGALSAVGGEDIFVAEFTASGACTWSKGFGASGQYQDLSSAAVDGAGNVLISGQASGADFGGGAETGFFIAKYTSAGSYLWSDSFNSTTANGGPSLAVDAVGAVILAGTFNSTIQFGAEAPFDSGGFANAFVAKFDPAGTYEWANQYGTGGPGAIVSDVATDACGNILLVGDFGGTLDFGTTTLDASNPNVAYAFVAKLSPGGSGVWGEEFEASSADGLAAGSVAVDGAGGPTVTFGLAGSVNYGGGTLTSGSSGQATLSFASFNSDGGYRWSYAANSSSTSSPAAAVPQGVAASLSSVVIVGEFGGPGTTLVFPGQTLDAVAEDLFIASFDP